MRTAPEPFRCVEKPDSSLPGWMRGRARAPLGLALAAVLGILLQILSGCQDYWYGSGSNATAAVTTPSGIQTGNVNFTYTLTGDDGYVDIEPSYSTNQGLSYSEGTDGPGGDGRTNLLVSPTGEVHTYVWASGTDLSARRSDQVVFKVKPVDGRSGSTNGIQVHNACFLAALQNTGSGTASRVDLYAVDLVDGTLKSLQTAVDAGGINGFDLLYYSGFFYLGEQRTSGTTNSAVASFSLDTTLNKISTVVGNPFVSGGSGAKYLDRGRLQHEHDSGNSRIQLRRHRLGMPFYGRRLRQALRGSGDSLRGHLHLPDPQQRHLVVAGEPDGGWHRIPSCHGPRFGATLRRERLGYPQHHLWIPDLQ
jgi:hypothetical protein